MIINDRALGLVGIVLATAYAAVALQFPEPFGGPEVIGPETFPLIIAATMAVPSIFMLLRPDPDQPWPSGSSILEIIIAIATLIIYTYSLEFIGFIISTTFAVGILCWRMGAKPKPAFLVGLIAGIAVYFLFGTVLDLSLPAGILNIGDI